MAILRVKEGPLPGAAFPVFSTRQPTVIGRDQSVEIPLQDQRASRRHAAVSLDQGHWSVEDLDSLNGTFLQGKRISRARLSDGMTLHVGSHLLSFHENELAAPPADEFYGTRLVETLREEAGVFVCRGYQHAMDRDVRVDWLHPKRGRPERSVLDRLRQAIDEARSLPGGRLLPILRGRVSPRIDDTGEAKGLTYVILHGGIQPTLEARLGQILLLDVAERALLFRQLVERIIERASHPLLSYPIGLANICVAGEPGAAPRLSIPALDLGAYLASETGDASHLPGVAPYLAPECRQGSPHDGYLALTYNLGAIGCRLLTGRFPGSETDVVPLPGNNGSGTSAVSSGLVSLLEQMLARDPGRRPPAGDELLRKVLKVTDGAGAPPRERNPATNEDVFWELEDEPFDSPRDGPPARVPPRKARPPRPSLTPRRRAKRSPGLLYLPLWILLWVGLFFVARYLSGIVFRELGL